VDFVEQFHRTVSVSSRDVVMCSTLRSKIASLTLCNDSEYAEFVPLQVIEYARQLVQSGEVPEASGIAAAEARLQDLRADRLRSAGHDVFVARSASFGPRVGWVWLSPAPEFLRDRERTRWLSQLTVDEACRGQGWSRAILAEVEAHEAARGTREIWLRVFNWNTVARHVYQSQGYELVSQFTTDAHWRKRLV
jgi:ribosomal protein S18 acetylase RimI-like enzyme